MEAVVDGLQWLPASFRQGFSVTFARGVRPDELLRRLGCAPCLTSMTRADAERYEVGAGRVGAVLRAGTSGDWAYALQMWGAVAIEESAMTAASAGTECVVLVSTSTIPWFAYMVDGDEICAFDPGLPHIRYGTGTSEMVAAMADAGFAVDGKPAAGGAVEAMLRLAEQHFGLGLPKHEVIHDALAAGIVND
ncbi:DUF6461 domain-containing protein [Streptomyces sp. NPDC057910]|uniref:DUF6461 domain-containing protein n=1 Tax=Streptomyces sp. NPDC057910 TaxID=3346278 RepID=UPI0036EAC24F